MKVSSTRPRMTSYLYDCLDCDFCTTEDYAYAHLNSAKVRARIGKHVMETGHSVSVQTVYSNTYRLQLYEKEF